MRMIAPNFCGLLRKAELYNESVFSSTTRIKVRFDAVFEIGFTDFLDKNRKFRSQCLRAFVTRFMY